MRWMAANSLFTNGDGADEVYFYVDNEQLINGQVYFHILPWDFDDFFKPIHESKINQEYITKYPNSLIYNYEGFIDRLIADDEVLYQEFKTICKKMIET